jgi:hypothetical protein
MPKKGHVMNQASVWGTPASKPGQAVSAPGTALEALAAAFDPKEFATALVSGEGRVPRLTVVSRRAHISQDVYVDNGWFWYSWAERIAAVSDVDQAAVKIAYMFRTTLPPIRIPQP